MASIRLLCIRAYVYCLALSKQLIQGEQTVCQSQERKDHYKTSNSSSKTRGAAAPRTRITWASFLGLEEPSLKLSRSAKLQRMNSSSIFNCRHSKLAIFNAAAPKKSNFKSKKGGPPCKFGLTRTLDCAIISFRQRTHNRKPALCNCSNADMQSKNDQTLSPFVLVENKRIR